MMGTLVVKGLIKNSLEFPGIIRKKSCGISRGLGFRPGNFRGVQHNFVEFLGVKHVLNTPFVFFLAFQPQTSGLTYFFKI